MSPTTRATLTLLLLAPARTLADGATATARVYYIRHGQSQWNAEQTAMRKSGLSDAAIKKIGDEERFVDSPLSARGVNDALTLQRNLTLTPDAPWYTLGGVARCALARTCAPAALLTSSCGARSRTSSGCGRSSSRRSTTGCTACSCCPRCRRRAATPTACRRRAAPTARSPRRRRATTTTTPTAPTSRCGRCSLRGARARAGGARDGGRRRAARSTAATTASTACCSRRRARHGGGGRDEGASRHGVLPRRSVRDGAARGAARDLGRPAQPARGARATLEAAPHGSARRASIPRAARRGAECASLGAAAERRRRRRGGAPGARQEGRARRRAPRRLRRPLALPARAAAAFHIGCTAPVRSGPGAAAVPTRLAWSAPPSNAPRRAPISRARTRGWRTRAPSAGSSRSRLPTRRARCPPSRCTAAASTTAARCCLAGRRRRRPAQRRRRFSLGGGAHGGVARTRLPSCGGGARAVRLISQITSHRPTPHFTSATSAFTPSRSPPPAHRRTPPTPARSGTC